MRSPRKLVQCSNRILANLDDRALREHFLGSELAANR